MKVALAAIWRSKTGRTRCMRFRYARAHYSYEEIITVFIYVVYLNFLSASTKLDGTMEKHMSLS